MKKLYNNYINTFRGLSTEVWWLALITFINRSGTMVIPFLSLYLTKSLHFSLSDVGWIMSFFGLGSVVGTWIGGKLTDIIGYYKVMLVSLFGTGILFVFLQFASTFNEFCFGIFMVMLVADAFRPAMFVALSAYSKPENKTRSVTLIRLAINLGFSAGPAIGGLIITGIGYAGLFWMDGITCVSAAFLLLKVLHPKKAKVQDEVKVETPISVYKDKAFWVFFIAMFIFGFVFMQYFSTIPLYYSDKRFLSEFEIGLLMGLSGLFIFLLEMPLIKWLEDLKKSKVKLIALGLFLVGFSFIILNLTGWVGILIIGILLMSVGEMIAFPFSNAFAIDRAEKGNKGEYMALYSIAFSLSHIFSHNVGMQLVAKFGFETTWMLVTAFAFVGVLILFYLLRVLRKELI
ncbi:MFS transporter [Polaribacter undariae]|uniref:MFS transporter n=1 Tax=Polaribacter sejongensis TaxID=985043 RepID=A0AAJ1QX55_9FLAO|nr:MFS transporter [Polaribacter undariae]MDN3619710.1 MFS transporter [Polaribacter undariae]UWD31477.1 MFS transporter [Polaribacter undariae]